MRVCRGRGFNPAVLWKLLSAGDAELRVVCRDGRCSTEVRGVAVEGLGLEPAPLMGECEAVAVAPPPDSGVRGGRVCFGRLASGRRACIPYSLLWRHVGVFGATGSGKSTTAAVLAREASAAGAAVAVLDWHGEYELLLEAVGAQVEGVVRGSSLPKLPLYTPSLPRDVVVDVLEAGLQLTPHQAEALYKLVACIEEALSGGSGCPDSHLLIEAARTGRLSMLIEWVEGRARGALAETGSRAEAEVWAAVARRLRAVEHTGLFTVVGSPPEPPKLGVRVYDLSSIAAPRARRLYAALLLRSFYDYASLGGPMGDLLVIVEEAHNVGDRESGELLPQLLSEARKYGLGFVVVEQSPSRLHEAVPANLNTLILHRLVARRDVELLHHLLPGLPWDAVTTLPVGDAVVVTPAWPEPRLVHVEA